MPVHLRHGSGLARAAALMTFVVVLLGLGTVSAAAAPGIELSRDGVTYAAALPGGLFEDITITVPGDGQSTDFWVRNVGPVPAYLRVAITGVSVSDPVLADALVVNASTAAHPGTAASLSSALPCRVLTEGDLLAVGAAVHVTATMELDDLMGLSGQGGTAGFSLQIALSDSTIPLPPTICSAGGAVVPVTGGDSAISLASTGYEALLPLIIGVASLTGVGLFLLVASRRRRKAEE